MNETSQQRVYVVDFGAQYGQLIARRVRDLRVFSEVVSCDIELDVLKANPPAAIILSGGPASVYAADAPKLNPQLLELGVPVLGFCYGMQAMAQALGGSVAHIDNAEYGPAELSVIAGVSASADEPDTLSGAHASLLFKGTPQTQTVWMSHRDAVSTVPCGFTAIASTPTTPIAAMESAERGLYAVQFHPEVHHTAYGNELLKNFLFEVACIEPHWTMDSITETTITAVRAQVGESRVILGLSGGVDSSVVAALLARAIGKQLTCVFVDHGLLRKGEPEEVKSIFSRQFDLDFVYVDAAERFLSALDKVKEPEEKRSIIGSLFWKVFFEEAEKIALRTGEPVRYLAQGTIYPDVIESGASRGGVIAAAGGSAATGSKKAATIKSHHNLVPFPEGVHFDLIEPLRNLFKDEVRALGFSLGLPDHLVYRQPFPGPGLAIRIIGDVTAAKLSILKGADAIVREEIDAYNELLFEQTGQRESEQTVWQYFAVLPDVKSVGVMGDERTYEYPIILRAVESKDAMTVDWARLPYDVLARVSNRVVSEVDGINRVAYDITPKPPATIEWE